MTLLNMHWFKFSFLKEDAFTQIRGLNRFVMVVSSELKRNNHKVFL